MITLEEHQKVIVLRDDLLAGGTKSILMPHIIGEADEYIYASPVYGGFQVALSLYCKQIGKRATIFCADRIETHRNTVLCMQAGAKVMKVRPGYLSVIEKRAKDYQKSTPGSVKLVFGAKSEQNINLIADRMQQVIQTLGFEPVEVFCAIGSGTLVEGILKGTTTAEVHGVQVGKEYTGRHDRLTVHNYHKDFSDISKIKAPFPSMPNYDLKAWEYCLKYRDENASTFFWNVL